MKRFAIQHPKTRGFMNEWFFHQFLKYNGLIFLRYQFINVSINGDNYPIYALEENFGKRLIENNNRKEGLIFQITYNPNKRIDIQQSQSEIEKLNLNKQIELVNNNVNLFFENKLAVSDVFDVNSLAKYFSILDLWGNAHAGQLKNIRFYL